MHNSIDNSSDTSSENSDSDNNSDYTGIPRPTPRVSLPVRFANPNIPGAERPVAEISIDNLLVGRTDQLVDTNETLFQNINRNLLEVDRVIDTTANILAQTINIDNMENNGTLFDQTIREPGTSREPNDNSQDIPAGQDLSNRNETFSNNIQNHVAEPSNRSDRSVDTIGLEAALKLLPSTFSGVNQEDLELFLEQCEFAIMCANDKAKPRLLQGILVRLTGKARAAIKFRTINSWNELKETLKKSLEPQRTTTHLYLELYSSKQKIGEDVMAYSTRIETLQTLILEQETSGKSMEAATALENSLKAQTIQVFIEGLGKLKDFIKARNPPTLEKAIQAAREEERVQKSLAESKRFYEDGGRNSRRIGSVKPSTPCYHCKKMGHWARDCTLKATSSAIPARINTIICNYCKKPGHKKEVCRKLKYVTSQRNSATTEHQTKTGNATQSGVNGGRPAGSIKTAAISFHESS